MSPLRSSNVVQNVCTDRQKLAVALTVPLNETLTDQHAAGSCGTSEEELVLPEMKGGRTQNNSNVPLNETLNTKFHRGRCNTGAL